MLTNKVPNINGLTVEFYRAFWDILCPNFIVVWAKSEGNRELTLSSRRAMLTLLLKKGKPCNMKNRRPVCLLCIDCKVVVKAISLYPKSMLVRTIYSNQMYVVPGRSIFDNLYQLQNSFSSLSGTVCHSASCPLTGRRCLTGWIIGTSQGN